MIKLYKLTSDKKLYWEAWDNGKDLDKRYELQSRMDETLGWTGLGHCDGGSIGSGTMEVCCIVIDYDLAKEVIEADLDKTEFADYKRIYCEEFAGEDFE